MMKSDKPLVELFIKIFKGVEFMSTATLSDTKKERILSIDRFRGTVIFCMIIFQFMSHFHNLGLISHISSHAPDANAIYFLPNFAIADIVAPMFIFAIALGYMTSFRRRQERESTKAAVLHFVQRYLILIGIGIAMNGVNNVLDGDSKPLNYAIIALTVLILVAGIVTLIVRGKAKKVIKKTLGGLLIVAGVAGVVIAFVNFIMLVTGKTKDSVGYWLVLHHIGFAGLVALPFALVKGKKGTITRFIAGFGMLGLFTLFHEGDLANDLFANNLELVDCVADGGFAGGFAWGAMLLLFTAFADLYYESKKQFLVATAIYLVPVAALLAGIFKTLPEIDTFAGAMSTFMPINKGSVSPSFVLISVALGLIFFNIYDAFNFYKGKFDPLAWWGKNPFLLYIIEFAAIGGLTAALGGFFETANVAVSAIIVIVTATLLTLLAYILDKKNIILKL